MHLPPKAFGPLGPRAAAASRTSGKKPRRLHFESLEVREVLSTSPFYFSNETFSDAARTKLTYAADQIYLSIYASTFDATPVYYYFDSTGAVHPTQGLANVPSFQLSALPTAANGDYVINMPDELNGERGVNSGRIYFSMGDPLKLKVNDNGSVNAPSLTANSYYDSVEFTINAQGQPYRNLNMNLTSVDQWGVPLQFKIDSSDPGNPDHAIGTPTTTSRAMVVSMFQTFSQSSIFSQSLDSHSGANGPYRILNPSHLLDNATVEQTPIWVRTVLQLPITTTTQTLINVSSATAFPDPSNGNFTIQIDDEQMTVTAASAPLQDGTTNWTVIRGVNNTVPATHVGSAPPVTIVGPAISATQTTLPVGSGAGFPPPSVDHPFSIVVDREIMTVTGVAADNRGAPVWTVKRGQAWTIPLPHAEYAPVYYNAAVTSPFNSYFNTAIDKLFDTYSKTGVNLTLQSVGSGTSELYDGHVTTINGCTVLEFWQEGDENGFKYDVYYPFFQDNRYMWQGWIPEFTQGNAPSWSLQANVQTLSPSAMVFSCNGVFADNTGRNSYSAAQQKVVADLENQIASALNRGVAQLTSYTADGTNSWLDTSKYYGQNTTGQVWNQYAQFLHKADVSIDGLNYGFAFDDKGAQSSDVGVASFNSVTVTLGAWSATPAPPPPPPPTPPQLPSKSYSMRQFIASRLVK